ncbi:MAG TPA: hypothetical protein VGB67_00920 [Fibrella sp.]
MKEITAVNFLGGLSAFPILCCRGDLPAGLRQAAELCAGCVSGVIQQDTYLCLIDEAGFVQVTIQKTKPINLPDSLLANYLTEAEIAAYRQGSVGIVSVTVYAPGTLPTKSVAPAAKTCCGPDCCS